jgi:hypothetical protein
MTLPKLYVGPMSLNIIDTVIENNINVGIIASRRQIDWDGGYVCGWKTSQLHDYIKGKNIPLCRDHGGPLQGKYSDDGFQSLENDIKFMDVIHVDPWKLCKTYGQGLRNTASIIKFCYEKGYKGLFEVGTEEAIYPMDTKIFNQFLQDLKYNLGDLFYKIKYAVIQGGTKLLENTNIGNPDLKSAEEMIDICKKFGVLSKEHNSDYQDINVIKHKFDLGLDAVNIAPELGMIESSVILEYIKDNNSLVKSLFNLCIEAGYWKKWVEPNFKPENNMEKIILISGHYVFSDTKFKNLVDLNVVKPMIKTRLLEWFKKMEKL